MRISVRLPIIAAAVGALGIAGPALADDDRKPSAQEARAITAALNKAGYTDWEEIEFDRDDNRWEVDDAKDREGRRWDLHLAPKTYAVIARDRED